MCGVFGFSDDKKASKEHIMLFRNLLIEDTKRGRDSTGFVICGDGKAWINKKAVDGHDFVADGEATLLSEKGFSCAIGHNRAASSGAVNDRNAHPFGLRVNNGWDFACHNGTFSRDIAEFLKTENYDVDSEVVLTAIARKMVRKGSLTDAMRSVLGRITTGDEGNYAILYLATGKKEVYAVKDMERPLWAFKTRNYGTWLCSTKDIFRKAWLNLEGGVLPAYKSEVYEELSLKPFLVYKLSKGKILEVDSVLSPKQIQKIEDEIKREKEKREKERRDWEKYRYSGYGYHQNPGVSGNQISLLEEDDEDSLLLDSAVLTADGEFTGESQAEVVSENPSQKTLLDHYHEEQKQRREKLPGIRTKVKEVLKKMALSAREAGLALKDSESMKWVNVRTLAGACGTTEKLIMEIIRTEPEIGIKYTDGGMSARLILTEKPVSTDERLNINQEQIKEEGGRVWRGNGWFHKRGKTPGYR